MKIKLISAMSLNRVIGKNNEIPWKIKEEMAFFREKTLNSTIVMGYNTWLSLKKILPKRINVVVTSKAKIMDDMFYSIIDSDFGPFFVSSIEYALRFNQEDKYIIGGAKIYDYCLKNDLVDEMYLSVIKENYDGDTYFPEFDESKWNKEVYKEFEKFKVLRYVK